MEKLAELPQHVKRYSELHFKKKRLLEELKSINASLKEIDDQLHVDLQARGSGIFEINPVNPEESEVYGPYGAIQLKTTNAYENLGTKDPLAKGCIGFFRHLFPTVSEEEVTKLGYGQMEWLWANRDKKVVTTVERVYAEDREKTRAKRKTPTTDKEKTPKKPRSEKPKDFPKTLQDFNNLNCVQALQQHMDTTQMVE